ncbi:DUF4212 domain-containing protein [Natrarchaeobius chitinivorans]|uniref:DUF4212 domain-containing protein n=1 Tax=Natrarchaeobius chitinivorans TaxID=1679083 RepID=A0A3N6MF61_NATCH|nr:DUF4212 domain-containing protein [Natrarchaeobius chitinivorans]RQG92526.1 DUF4212 domain-containing protein [Natrarchaeobius chitinivorans]
MSNNNKHDSADAVDTDGGVKTEAYLDEEINIFKPATPFMRDHLRVIWGAFAAWVLVVFGPTTAILIAPTFMTETTILGGFPLHFLFAAILTPLGALLLSIAYAIQRDRLDTRYGISHEQSPDSSDSVATDGGED